MAKVDILATWQACKALVTQAEEYANKGYSRVKDHTGQQKLNRFLDEDEPEDPNKEPVQLTTNNVPKEILDALNTEFAKVLDFVELYLLQDNGAAFYGLILVELDIGINYAQRGLVDVDVKKKPFKITYNPFFAKDYSLNELLGATINEIMKIVYMHPVTYAKLNRQNDPKNHEDLEIGSSVSSTEMVLRDVKFDGNKNRVKLNDKTYTRSDLEDEIDSTKSVQGGASLEYYYKVAQGYRKPKPGQDGQGQGQGQGNSQGQNNPNAVATPGNGQGNQIHQWEAMPNPSDTQEELKDVIKEAYDALSEKQRGTLPAGMIQHIEQLFKKPELNWKDILRKYVGIIPSGHRPSRLRLNRRQPDRFDLCGQLSNKVVRLVIAIDTSGSMSDREIAYCMNEIYNIVKDYKTEITVIECDAEIGKVYKVRNTKEIQTKVSGRGGTSFIPVIEYINSHKFKDAVMIYFTDGYGDYEIPRPRTYRNLWVIMRDATALSVKNPYGEVKSLKGDADFMEKFR